MSLLVVLVLLVVADGIITRFLVTNGLGVEINPFLANWVGDDSFLWVKLAGGTLAALILLGFSRQAAVKGKLKTAIVIIAILVAFYAAVVIWNLLVLFITTG